MYSTVTSATVLHAAGGNAPGELAAGAAVGLALALGYLVVLRVLRGRPNGSLHEE